MCVSFVFVWLYLCVCVCVTWWMSRSSVRSNLCVSEGGLVHSSHVSLLTYYSIDNISLSLCSPEYSVFVLLLFSSSFYKLFSRPSSVIICSQISLRNQRLSIILRVARWKILSCFFFGEVGSSRCRSAQQLLFQEFKKVKSSTSCSEESETTEMKLLSYAPLWKWRKS